MGKVYKISKTIIFCVVFVVIFVWLSYFFRMYDGENENIPSYYMEPHNTIDVVCIGGSAMFPSWEPPEAYHKYGITSHNFSQSSMPPQVIKYCVIEALKTQKPKLIVIDLRMFPNAHEGSSVLMMNREAPLRKFTDHFRYSQNRFNMIKNAVPRDYNKLYYYFDIAKYHENISNLRSEQAWNYSINHYTGTNIQISHGFENYVLYQEIELTDHSDVTDEISMPEITERIYIDLIDYLKTIDAQVLFINTPYAQPVENKKYINYMSRLANENGFNLLDFNDYYYETGINGTTDYYNTGHMNIFGAEKFTDWFANYISENYNLPDRRTDSYYQKWDDDYAKWIPIRDDLKRKVYELMPEEAQAQVLRQMPSV